eukprot:398291_1
MALDLNLPSLNVTYPITQSYSMQIAPANYSQQVYSTPQLVQSIRRPLAMNISIRSRSRIVPRMAATPPIQRRMATVLPMAAALPSAEAAAPPRQRRMATLLPMAAALPSAEVAASAIQRRMPSVLPFNDALRIEGKKENDAADEKDASRLEDGLRNQLIWKDVAELENVPEEDSDHDRNEGQEPLYSDVDWDDYMAPGDSASTDRILPLKYYRGFKKHEFIQMEGLNWKKAMIPERSWIR